MLEKYLNNSLIVLLGALLILYLIRLWNHWLSHFSILYLNRFRAHFVLPQLLHLGLVPGVGVSNISQTAEIHGNCVVT